LQLQTSGLLDVSQATLVAPDADFSLQAAGIRGTLQTQLAGLSVVNTSREQGFDDIVVREADSLRLVGAGLSTASGDIDVQLLGHEALLSSESGVVAAGHDVTLVADDIDLKAGAGTVRGSGALVVRSQSATQGYHIGSAGQAHGGEDLSPFGASGFLELGQRDLSALQDGFASLTLGHRGTGVLMLVGDVRDGSSGNTGDFSARLDDVATLQADVIEVVGNVQSSQRLVLEARALRVANRNVHAPMGAADVASRPRSWC